MMRSTNLAYVLLAAMVLALTSNAQKLETKSLKDLLSKQGFTGLLQGKVTFNLLGKMKCNSAIVQIYYYTWEEANPPGRAIHFSQRIIFIENRNYLGQYVVSDRPVLVKQEMLRFHYSKEDGNTIQCDQGGLPESVHLDGHYIGLER
jgi:hypothetical protein